MQKTSKDKQQQQQQQQATTTIHSMIQIKQVENQDMKHRILTCLNLSCNYIFRIKDYIASNYEEYKTLRTFEKN